MSELREQVDDWRTELLRTGKRPRTVDTYTKTAVAFTNMFPTLDPSGIQTRHIERFVGSHTGISRRTGREYEPNTRVLHECALSSLTRFLLRRKLLTVDPFLGYERTRRKPADKQRVTTVSSDDVVKMLQSAWRTFFKRDSISELICLAFLVYLGPRRSSLAQLRCRHIDLERGTVEFPEWKGQDHFRMEMPDELAAIVEMAYAEGHLDNDPDAYVVPNLVPSRVTKLRRDDRAIWHIVKKVAGRVGVDAHVHSLRAAFACFYMDSNPSADALSLKEVMGHASLATTEVYLRRIKRRRAMETVRPLSWGVPNGVVGSSPNVLLGEATRVTGVRGRRPRPLDECAPLDGSGEKVVFNLTALLALVDLLAGVE